MEHIDKSVMYDGETGELLHRDIRPVTISYHGMESTFDMPGWYPKGEGEGTFTKQDMKVYSREINRLKAREQHLVQPAEIRRIRKKLKLTQVEAGEVIGGGKRAFQKYESGEVLPSKAASNLLRVLYAEPKLLQVLEG